MRRHVAICICALLAAACGTSDLPERPPNAIIVLVDALRADHLGAYGYARPTSPSVDAFARESWLFTQARAQAPCTHPSVASLLTGLYPSRFRRFQIFGFTIPPRFPTLASLLRAEGFATAAVSASPIVRKTPSRSNPAGGYGAGFEQFHEDCLDLSAACVNREALRLLDELPEPFFLYLHYMEPHDPYRPPVTYRRRFAKDQEAAEFVRTGNPRPIAASRYGKGPAVDVRPGDWSHLIDLYDEEIRYFDERFAELLDGLTARGLAARTAVVLASDHGEEFFEHGDVMHCRNVHDVEIRTPLVVRVPGRDPRTVDAAVGNVDLAPTLLDVLGIGVGDTRFDGRSLVPVVEGGPARFAAFGDWRGAAFATNGRFKVLVDHEADRTTLYDLATDPGETRDVSGEHADVARSLMALLDEYRAATDDDPPSKTDTDLIERLRALGYLE